MASLIYIAYTEGDRQTAEAVSAALERAGMRDWLISRDVLVGMDPRAAALMAVDSSAAYVLILSPTTEAGPAFVEQVNRARERSLPLITLNLGNPFPPSVLAEALQNATPVMADVPPSDAQLVNLVQAVQSSIGRATSDQAATVADPAPPTPAAGPRIPPLGGPGLPTPPPALPLPTMPTVPPLAPSPGYGAPPTPAAPVSTIPSTPVGYAPPASPPAAGGYGTSAPPASAVGGYGSATSPPPAAGGYRAPAPPQGAAGPNPAAGYSPPSAPRPGGVPGGDFSRPAPKKSSWPMLLIGGCLLVLFLNAVGKNFNQNRSHGGTDVTNTPSGWSLFSSPGGEFKALMPGSPVLGKKIDGPYLKTMYSSSDGTTPYVVAYFDVDQVGPITNPKQVLDALKKAKVEGLHADLSEEKDITVGSQQGQEYVLRNPQGPDMKDARFHTFMVGNRVFQMMVTGEDTALHSPEADQFFNSIQAPGL